MLRHQTLHCHQRGEGSAVLGAARSAPVVVIADEAFRQDLLEQKRAVCLIEQPVLFQGHIGQLDAAEGLQRSYH